MMRTSLKLFIAGWSLMCFPPRHTNVQFYDTPFNPTCHSLTAIGDVSALIYGALKAQPYTPYGLRDIDPRLNMAEKTMLSEQENTLGLLEIRDSGAAEPGSAFFRILRTTQTRLHCDRGTSPAV